MRKGNWIVLGVLATVAFVNRCFPQDFTKGAPVSGIIVKSNYTVWFDGINTRRETRFKEAVTLIHVTGDRNWAGSPVSGRLFPENKSLPPMASFPEETVRAFSYTTRTNAMKVGEESVNGLPCWKYSVRRKERGGEQGRTTERTRTYYFLSNPDFPLLIKVEDQPISDVPELKLNCPVPKDLFVCPTDLKPSRAFSLPRRFEIEVRETRQSYEVDLSWVSTNFLASDGEQVRSRYVQLSKDPEGRVSQFGPKLETNSVVKGLSQLNYPLEVPYWGAVRKVGEAEVLGLKADIYESIVSEKEFFWVVDHPVVGTFSARRATGSIRTSAETNEVVKLEISK